MSIHMITYQPASQPFACGTCPKNHGRAKHSANQLLWWFQKHCWVTKTFFGQRKITMFNRRYIFKWVVFLLSCSISFGFLENLMLQRFFLPHLNCFKKLLDTKVFGGRTIQQLVEGLHQIRIIIEGMLQILIQPPHYWLINQPLYIMFDVFK